MAVLQEAIYMFNAIPIKIPMTFITQIGQSILKIISKNKRTQIRRQHSAKRAMLKVSQLLTSTYSNKISMILAQKQT
jgi:hypothetical protein